MAEDTKNQNGLFMILSIPVIIQTAYFAILLIQQTESTAFRLFIGFVGIGLTIVPFLLNRTVGDPAPNKSIFKINITPQVTLLIDIIGIIAITVSPWIPIFQNHALSAGRMTWQITPGSVMAISSSIFAFSFAGIAIFIKNARNDERWLTILRIVIILSCVAAVMKVYIPTLLLFIFRCSVLIGSPQNDIFQMAVSGHFWQIITLSISDIFTWQSCFFISLFFQYRFYKRWLGNSI